MNITQGHSKKSVDNIHYYLQYIVSSKKGLNGRVAKSTNL
jgi:hypothetical protein